jgi:hypothetical protein
MSKKRRHHVTAPILALGSDAEESARIDVLIASGRAREAVERAKAVVQRTPSAAAEARLARAFGARIDALLRARLPVEAAALVRIAVERLPAHRAELLRREAYAAALGGDVGPLLAPLARPDLEAAARAAVEAEIRQWVLDPAAVAACPVLPADHPLRVAAGALARAFAAVTSGPVAAEALVLPEVSRRSPLAPWRPLIAAIAARYRGEAETVASLAAAIPADAAPARLVPVLRYGTGAGDAEPTGRALELARRLANEAVELQRALAPLEAALRAGEQKRSLTLMGAALRACATEAPDLEEPLRRRLAARGRLAGLLPESVDQALGRPPRADSACWRLTALCRERWAQQGGNPMTCGFALLDWEQHLRHALAEGRIQPGSVGEAAVLLRMARLRATADALAAEIRVAVDLAAWRSMFPVELRSVYQRQPEEIRRQGLGEPDRCLQPASELYRQAAAICPDARVLDRWIACVRAGPGGARRADDVAQEWRERRPGDLAPVLHLLASAERRGSRKQALGLLAEAEARGGSEAELGPVRRRLLVASLVGHLRKHQEHLARKDLAQLAALPAPDRGDRPALLAALSGMCQRVAGGPEGEAATARSVAERLGDEVAGRVFLTAVEASVMGYLPPPPRSLRKVGPAKQTGPALLMPVARALAALQQEGLPLVMAPEWTGPLARELRALRPGLDPSALLVVARAAVEKKVDNVAFAATAAGLALASPWPARFLILRGQVLEAIFSERRQLCLRAAFTLARQAGDEPTVQAALAGYQAELEVRRGRRSLVAITLRPLDPALAARVVEREAKVKTPPSHFRIEDRWWSYFDPEWNDRWMAVDQGGLPPDQRLPWAPGAEDDDFEDDLDDDDDWDDDDEGDADEVVEVMSKAQARKLARLASAQMPPTPGVPDELRMAAMEAMLRFGGVMPEPEQLARLDPELYDQIDRLYAILSQHPELDFSAPQGPRPRGRRR